MLQRSRTTRPVGGALVLVALLSIALVTSVLTGPAQADDPAGQPSAAATGAEDPTEPSPGDPSDPADPGQSETDGPVRQLVEGMGPVRATPKSWVIKRGLSTSVNLTTGNTCPSSDCTYRLSRPAPAGWRITVTSSGTMGFRPPADTRPGRYTLYYRLTSAANGVLTDESTVSVAVTPDAFAVSSRMIFSHPYRKRYRYKIRNQILRTINSVPAGARIQVASWSFSSKTYRKALTQAKRRGVVVQIVLAQRNRKKNSDYARLVRNFGTTVTPNGSWVRKCRYSCRGVSGTMHSKIFLFSQVYRRPYVMMTGSANLTDFAVTNQWNQMNITVGDKPIYDEGVRIFTQLYADRRASPMYVETTYPTITSYFYPTTSESTRTDFMYRALNHVQCRGATNTRDGRTIVRIAMYAWYEDRGKWLAKQVRQLWQEGCRVQIIYAISSNPVKRVLYAPSGRGRIPMRQILLTNTNGTPIYYLHDKWVAIRGSYGGSRAASLAFQGSFNFSDLGFRSDENFQMLRGSSYYRVFNRDFKLLWKDRQARAPSPISKIPTIEGRYSRDDLRLGTGVYRYMDAD